MTEHVPGSQEHLREAGADDAVERLLARVTRPGRYVGGEFNMRRKPQATPRIVLSYPDVYEIGISNPALQILYSHLTTRPPASAERAYCPWPDMAGLMRAADVPLWTLESMRPVPTATCGASRCRTSSPTPTSWRCSTWPACRCTPRSAGKSDPIVLGGGPAVADPWPLAPFFDAFFIGEVGAPSGAIVEALGAPRRAQRLARLGGACPACGCPARRAAASQRQVFTGFAITPPVLRPVVPVLEAVHDRVVVEVMRGCTAGCRFCQAGMWYRPVRERPVDLVVRGRRHAARRDRLRRGLAHLAELVRLQRHRRGRSPRIRALRPGLRVSLPSLRIDSAAASLSRVAAEQRGSITLAPEAGTQELRDAINKGVDDAQFLEAVAAPSWAASPGLKLYFMIGLPGEPTTTCGASPP